MAEQSSHYYSITAASNDLSLPKHVIRFWESKFSVIKPMRSKSGRRYYRPNDMALLQAIKFLTHEQGYSIKGLNKLIKDYSPQQVIDLADEFRHNGTHLPDSLYIEPSEQPIANNDTDTTPLIGNAEITAIIDYIDQILALDAQHG